MLKTIKLYGDLREITGHSELDAHVNSVGESIRFLLIINLINSIIKEHQIQKIIKLIMVISK